MCVCVRGRECVSVCVCVSQARERLGGRVHTVSMATEDFDGGKGG